MRFTEVIGQEATKKRLLQMVHEDRLPHALLFSGPEGSGKMALAMAFASYLLAGGDEEDESDRNANARAMIAKWQHPDLHFVYPTIKLSSMGSEHQPVSADFIKEWRELLAKGAYFSMNVWMQLMGATTQQSIITGAESDQLARTLSLKSSQGGYKIVIIWRPERMNLTSANKLLKLLEEPPSGTVFLLVSEEPERLLETIISRTQRIEVKGIEENEIEKALIKQRGLEQDSAHRIAHSAHGSWLRALETLDNGNERKEFLDKFQALMRLCYKRDLKELRRWEEEVAGLGREKIRRLLRYFQQQIRENFIYNFKNPQLNYMTLEEENFAKRFSKFINEGNIIEVNELFERASRDIGQNANAKIVLYDMVLKLIILLLRK